MPILTMLYLEFILGTGQFLHTMNCYVKDYTEVDKQQHSK
jgi:hypothetical protein